MEIWTVVELEQENNKEKILSDTHAFSTREKALEFLHGQYLAARENADAGSGEVNSDYSEDGWYVVDTVDGDRYEGYLSESIPVE